MAEDDVTCVTAIGAGSEEGESAAIAVEAAIVA